jgi:hypothetical protein
MPETNTASQANDTIYKYTSQHGAECILTNKTLRFAKPSQMNDPFDVYIDDLLGMDLEEVHEHFIDRFVDTLFDDPQRCADLFGLPLEDVMAKSAFLQNATDEDRARIKTAFKSIDLTAFSPELKRLRDEEPKLRDTFVQYLKNCAIFCATRNPTNLLMWAHYADQHHGAVIGFCPDTTRDSMLARLEPVRYTRTRPALLSEDVLTKPTMDAAAQANRRLYLSKGTEWSYEEEFRLFIPGDIPPEETATYKTFYPNELVELYLGCRMSQKAKEDLTQRSIACNPAVHVYAVSIAKRAYGLITTRIV